VNSIQQKWAEFFIFLRGYIDTYSNSLSHLSHLRYF
jgi:hypothetical protein